MSIVFYRADERAIHGQTVVSWSKLYPVDGIILVSNKIADNPFLKEIYKKGALGLSVFIFNEETAKQRMPEANRSKKKYMLIAQELSVFWRMVENKLINPSKINVGPLTKSENSTMVVRGIYLSEEEKEACKKISNEDIEIEFQLLPDSTLKRFKDLNFQN